MRKLIVVSVLVAGQVAAAGGAFAARERALQIDHVIIEHAAESNDRDRAARRQAKQTADAAKGASTVCMFTLDIGPRETTPPKQSTGNTPNCRIGAPS